MTSPMTSQPDPQPAASPPQPMAADRPRSPVALLVGGVLGFSYLFLRQPAPAAVGLSSASPGATTAAASADPAPPRARRPQRPAPPTTGEGLDGTWTVDPSIGSFSDFSGSFVGYRVDEELANVGAATAVGRTPDVRAA